jgi:hypothetical protein
LLYNRTLSTSNCEPQESEAKQFVPNSFTAEGRGWHVRCCRKNTPTWLSSRCTVHHFRTTTEALQ